MIMTDFVAYQNIPSRPDIPFHRDKSDWRAKRICELVNIQGKRVLDLGCSVGTMSAIFRDNGASHVIGMDNDPEAFRIAYEIYGNKVQFVKSDINMISVKLLEWFDVVVWSSQFMWMVKQRGMDYALNFLFELSKQCSVLVFETAGKNDGSAPLDMFQEEIMPMLIKNTCFQKITDHGPWNDNWSPRNVFVCEKPTIKWDSHFSTVERIDRSLIKKTFIDSERGMELCERESLFLRQLNGNPNFPEFIEKTDTAIYMAYSGLPAIWIPEQDLWNILDWLDANNIMHRDIQPSNLLWNGKHCVLIDFTYAVNPGDVTNYHYDLGGKYKCPHGFNDEFSIKKVQAELICK